MQEYGRVNAKPPLGLQESTRVSDTSEISKLAQEIDALPAYPSGTMFCPMDDGSYFVLVFFYGGGTSAMVKVEARGCQGVYVGGSRQPSVWAAKSPGLFDLLRSLLA